MTSGFTLLVSRSAIRSGIDGATIASRLSLLPHQVIVRDSLSELLVHSTSRELGIWINFNERIDRKSLPILENLRFVATSSTGTTHIDEGFLRRTGVNLLKLDPESDEGLHKVTATVDLTLALLFGAATGALRNLNKSLSAEISSTTREKELASSTIGIIGMGRIGTRVGGVLQALGSRVVFSDIKPDNQLSPSARAFERVSLSHLLESSDLISLHASLDKSAAPILGAGEMERVKNGALLVNTARASLVEPAALFSALEQNRISSYATDLLFRREIPMTKSLEYREMRLVKGGRVFVTPHIGGACDESARTVEGVLLSKIQGLLLDLSG